MAADWLCMSGPPVLTNALPSDDYESEAAGPAGHQVRGRRASSRH